MRHGWTGAAIVAGVLVVTSLVTAARPDDGRSASDRTEVRQLGDEQRGGQPARRLPEQRPEAEEQAETLVSLHFEGGTIGAYVEALQRAAGQRNVVVAADIAELKMPPLHLTQVPYEEAVRVIESVARHDEWSLGVEALGSIYAIRGGRAPQRRMPGGQQNAEPEERTQVWTIGHLFDDERGADDVLSAVEAAVALEQTDVELRFHEPTGLLIARGPVDSLMVIEQVASSLHRAGQRRDQDGSISSTAAEAYQQRIEELEKRVEMHEAERIELQVRLAGLLDQKEDYRKLVDEERREQRALRARYETMIAETERVAQRREQELQLEIANRRSVIDELRRQLQTSQDRVAELEARLERGGRR